MELVSTIVGLVGEHSWGPIKCHLSYLIFYKRNIHNMEIKFSELDAKRKDVQQQVQAAYRERLEEVDSSVEAWLENVENADEDVKRIIDESTSAATNNKGFLHFCFHHRLGKQAAAQIQAIDDLLVKKGNFDRVSHSRPPPSTTGSLLVNEAKHMQQLTSLIIYDCDSLTAVVISNENQEEGTSASTSTSTTACAIIDHYGSHNFFPRLRKLVLKRLPKIAAFHQPTTLPMEWPCLKGHVIEECSKLETPLLGPQTSERIRVFLDQDGEDSEEKAWFL
ncbi:hypothetical protein J5N97_020722 [Dioscorea zingiberensis]|uniref:Disease resistance protein n=1 Tax=Dioscorea zingiberensis TaxID=325984 RepID=A0A9D5CGE2_9LILI|nr:hypothetical protein J5N97_020722 [Dioscorea zingiberensis]